MWQTQTDRVTGRGHQRQGMPCQDRVLSMERNGVTAIALADGAGSAALSHEGAECAVQAVCELLCENFDALFSAQSSAEVRHFLLSGVRDRIRERAKGTQRGVRPTRLYPVGCGGTRRRLSAVPCGRRRDWLPEIREAFGRFGTAKRRICEHDNIRDLSGRPDAFPSASGCPTEDRGILPNVGRL